MKTWIEDYHICSDTAYIDFLSKDRKFKRIKKLTKSEIKKLIGKLKIGNKYLVKCCGVYLYQHDFITYLCDRV